MIDTIKEGVAYGKMGGGGMAGREASASGTRGVWRALIR